MAFVFLSTVALLFLIRPIFSAPIGSSFGVPADALYDYVVVGSGNAGAPVAHRLSEAGHSVALVEAGSLYEVNNGNLSQIPANGGAFMGRDPETNNLLVDWGIVTTPQAGWNNASILLASGKTLGGSTGRNVMTYHLPTEGSMEKWADKVEDDSWNFGNILPYIMRSQHFSPPRNDLRMRDARPTYDYATLGRSGPLDIIYPNYASSLASRLARGFIDIGIAAIDGFTSGRLIGSGYALSTVQANTQLRESSKTAYLDPLIGRNLNLIIYQSTHAKQILFDNDRVATGVRVDSEGQEYILSARNEVIVSAGALKTPQLLMVSGIGPAENLERHDIPVVVDLQGVGQNLQDHTQAGLSFRVNVATRASIPVREAEMQFNSRPPRGVLTSPGLDVLGWEKVPDNLRINFTNGSESALAEFPEDWPELEYLPTYLYIGDNNDTSPAPNDGDYFSVSTAVITPLSRGTVDIASDDTFDNPIVDPRWFSHPADVDVAVAGFRRTRELVRTRSLANVTIEEAYPGPEVRTEDEIVEFLRSSSSTVHHYCCTAAMGAQDDSNAVVDTDGRVHGVSGLRVVDASIFPFLTPGHPMSVIYGAAEKIAESIIAEAQ
ncbi:hypothetical protein BDV06DRAFT_224235 [Aspergillus oleicola]